MDAPDAAQDALTPDSANEILKGAEDKLSGFFDGLFGDQLRGFAANCELPDFVQGSLCEID